MSEILAAIGALLAPIIREILPLVMDEWRKPDMGERVRETTEDREITETINEAWTDILDAHSVPPDYDLPR